MAVAGQSPPPPSPAVVVVLGVVLVGCLALAPFVAKHVRGTSDVIEDGLRATGLSDGMRAAFARSFHASWAVLVAGSTMALALAGGLEGLATVAGIAFFAAIAIDATLLLWARPRWAVPGRYR